MRAIIIMTVLMTAQTTWAKLILKPGAYRMQSTMTVDGKEVDVQKEMQNAMKEMQKSMEGMDLSMLPPEARKQMEKMSGENKLAEKLLEMCISQEDVNMDKKTIAKMMAQNESNDMKDCKSKVVKSTSKEVETKTTCSDGSMTFNMKALSPTKFEQVMTEYKKNGKKGDTVKITGTFFASKCPDHVLKRDAELKKLAKKWENIQTDEESLQKLVNPPAAKEAKKAPVQKTKPKK